MDAVSSWLVFAGIGLGTVAMAIVAYYGAHIFRKSYARYEERYLEAVGEQLEGMFATVAASQVLYLRFACAFILLLVGVLISVPAPLGAKPVIILVLAGLGYAVPAWYLKRMQARRVLTFNEQLVEALTSISNCLKSGFSFPQALELLVNEGRPPLSQEFSLVLREYRIGRTLDEALSHLLKRVPSQDLDIAVTSILITREIGGNLASVFDQIAETIRERSRIQGKIRALTSQGKLQGIVVGILPIALGIAVNYIDPKLMRPMYTTLLGWLFLSVIVVLELLGAFFIKKIVTIDV